jgi:hypothetical protein
MANNKLVIFYFCCLLLPEIVVLLIQGDNPIKLLRGVEVKMKKLLKEIKAVKNEIKELKDDWKNGSCDMLHSEYINYLTDLNNKLEELESELD